MNFKDRHIWFDTAEECAKRAAVAFRREHWTWADIGVPSEAQLLNQLRDLADLKFNPKQDRAIGGRLAFENGRFGYERPA